MDESILLRELGQVSSEEAGVVFRAYLRGCVRQMLTDVMAAEVTELCGAKHRPSESDHFRGGRVPVASCMKEGQREEVVRPLSPRTPRLGCVAAGQNSFEQGRDGDRCGGDHD